MEETPNPFTNEPTPPPQPQPSKQMIAVNIAAKEVFKYCRQGRLGSLIGIAGAFIILVASLFGRILGVVAGLLIMCGHIYFVYLFHKQMIYLDQKYGLTQRQQGGF